MADGTKIEWTDATWNPITGCAVVSAGCTNCYAMRLAGTRLRNHPSRMGLTKDTKAGPVWTGEVRFNREWLDQPLRWKRPRMIFVCAHGDLFAEGVPDEWIDQVFAVMALCRQHTFQVLTKRPERMREYLTRSLLEHRLVNAQLKFEFNLPEPGRWPHMPLPNVWLGVSVEDQKRADERIPILLDTPAAIRWISAEPLLWLLKVSPYLTAFMGGEYRGPRLDWVVAGGESGPGARPMHPDWARALRDQCAAAGVPFLFKQWGAYHPAAPFYADEDQVWKRLMVARQFGPNVDPDACEVHTSDGFFDYCRDFPDLGVLYRDGYWYDGEEWQPQINSGCYWMERVGKKAAGRLLDGIEHNGFPEVRR